MGLCHCVWSLNLLRVSARCCTRLMLLFHDGVSSCLRCSCWAARGLREWATLISLWGSISGLGLGSSLCSSVVARDWLLRPWSCQAVLSRAFSAPAMPGLQHAPAGSLAEHSHPAQMAWAQT